jgi:hypothetical protein
MVHHLWVVAGLDHSMKRKDEVTTAASEGLSATVAAVAEPPATMATGEFRLPHHSLDYELAEQLVAQAREDGVSLVGPDGLLSGDRRTDPRDGARGGDDRASRLRGSRTHGVVELPERRRLDDAADRCRAGGEVKGAIVGGLLGAAVVVAAVLGEAWLGRVWDRRRTVEATVLDLVALVPQIVNFLAHGQGSVVTRAEDLMDETVAYDVKARAARGLPSGPILPARHM